MKKTILMVAIATLSSSSALVSINASAAGGSPGFYVGGMFDYADGGVKSTQTIDSAKKLPTDTDVKKMDGFGVLLGFEAAEIDGLRIEVSYDQLNGDGKEKKASKGSDPLQFDTDYKINQFELTGIKEFNIGNPQFKPYLLAGVGYYDADLTYKSFATSNGKEIEYSSKKDNDSGFGYSLGVGLAVNFTKQISADLAYRYTDTGVKFQKKNFSDKDVTLDHSKLDVDSLNRLTASVRYKF